MVKVGPARLQELEAFALKTGTGFDGHLTVDLTLDGCRVMLRHALEDCRCGQGSNEPKAGWSIARQAGSLRLQAFQSLAAVEFLKWSSTRDGPFHVQGPSPGGPSISEALPSREPEAVWMLLWLLLSGPLSAVMLPNASQVATPASELLAKIMFKERPPLVVAQPGNAAMQASVGGA